MGVLENCSLHFTASPLSWTKKGRGGRAGERGRESSSKRTSLLIRDLILCIFINPSHNMWLLWSLNQKPSYSPIFHWVPIRRFQFLVLLKLKYKLNFFWKPERFDKISQTLANSLFLLSWLGFLRIYRMNRRTMYRIKSIFKSRTINPCYIFIILNLYVQKNVIILMLLYYILILYLLY